MTRSQRRIRARKLGQLAARTDSVAVFHERDADGEKIVTLVHLAENANRGKRHAARMTDAFLVELATAERKYYRPLTVSHPSQTPSGNLSKTRRTSYTV